MNWNALYANLDETFQSSMLEVQIQHKNQRLNLFTTITTFLVSHRPLLIPSFFGISQTHQGIFIAQRHRLSKLLVVINIGKLPSVSLPALGSWAAHGFSSLFNWKGLSRFIKYFDMGTAIKVNVRYEFLLLKNVWFDSIHTPTAIFCKLWP